MILLNVLPEKIYNVDNEAVVDTNLIEMDQNIVDRLRKV